MCGRFTLTLSSQGLVELFEVDRIDDSVLTEWQGPRYNIAPTDSIPVYLQSLRDGEVTRRLELARWGLVFGGKPSPFPLINSRLETLEGRSSTAGVFAKRRALVPADGYYEWKKEGSGKQPYYFYGDEPLAYAGLYQWAKAPDGSWMLTTSIVTRPPTELFGQVHDRMPLVLPRDFWQDWVNPQVDGDPALLHAALTASDEAVEGLQMRPVGKAVGSVKNEGPQLIAPLAE